MGGREEINRPRNPYHCTLEGGALQVSMAAVSYQRSAISYQRSAISYQRSAFGRRRSRVLFHVACFQVAGRVAAHKSSPPIVEAVLTQLGP